MTPDLKPMPLVSTVQVLRYDAEGQPWPVATIHIDAANKVAFTGDASKAYAPLLTAAKKAASRLAHQGIAEALQEARGLRKEAPAIPLTSEPEPPPELPAAGDCY